MLQFSRITFKVSPNDVCNKNTNEAPARPKGWNHQSLQGEDSRLNKLDIPGFGELRYGVQIFLESIDLIDDTSGGNKANRAVRVKQAPS